MLHSLSIENFTLIDTVSLQFTEGLSIITGETGAGKSILFDAILYVLGERFSQDILKDSSKKTFVEITFSSTSSLQTLLDELGFDSYPDTIVLRRELSPKGVTRCFVNDTPTTVANLKIIGTQIVDFHGQFDHQTILSKTNYFALIDSLSTNKSFLEEYVKLYTQLTEKIHELAEIKERIRSANEVKDYYQLQLEELEAINPTLGEIEEKEQLLKKLENAEDIFFRTNTIASLLQDDTNAVLPSIRSIEKEFEKLQRFDPAFELYSKELQQAFIILSEVHNFVQHYNRDVDFSEEQVQQMRLRLQELHKIRKKYGSIENALEKLRFFTSQLELSNNSEEIQYQIEQQISSLRQQLSKTTFLLFTARKQTLQTVEKSINLILKKLGMVHSTFQCMYNYTSISQPVNELYISDQSSDGFCSLHKNGIGTIDFLFSSNPGVEPKSLSSIASGGEISRVMLALKSIVADKDSLQLLIFDEIDTGISGSIAQKVGIVMKQLSLKKQILAITHLPQIAALADTHFLVNKDTSANQTSISIHTLQKSEMYNEVARLLSGENITPSSLQIAKELATIPLDF